MAISDARQQGMTMAAAAAAAAANEFLVGMRVLAVDDDHVCLKVLEALLRHCKYQVTTAMDGETVLRLLRAGKQKYDLVITDVYMPDMDGFTLLKLIRLEMDIPIIMLSADEEETSMLKGVSSGACAYLVKPVKIRELKNIWQHVVRRRISDPRVQPAEIAECEWAATKSTGKKRCSKRRMNGDDNADEYLSTKKKPRVKWTSELHGRFLQAINQIGIDNAAPKKIFKLMNVSYITKDAVASHLQKYRILLKRECGYTGRRSSPLGDSCEKWNSCNIMNECGSSSSSSNLFSRMNSSSHFGAHGVSLPTRSFYMRNPQSNLSMRQIIPGGSMLKDTRKLPPFGLCTNSFINISDDTTLNSDEVEDGDDELTTGYPGSSYASILRNKLLEASKGIPSDCFEDMTSDAMMSAPVKKILVQPMAMSVPVSQLPVQAPQLGNQHLVKMNCTLSRNDSHFQDIMENCSRSWQTMVPTELSDLGRNDGASASLNASRANVHKINQLARAEASSSKIPMLQDQMAALVSIPSPVMGLHEPTLPPYDLGGNTNSMDKLDGNFAVGSASSINPTFSGLETNNFFTKTPMLNGEDTVGNIPVLHEGIVDQLDYINQGPDGQMSYNNDFFTGTYEPYMTTTWDEIFANENFAPDDSFMDRDWI